MEGGGGGPGEGGVEGAGVVERLGAELTERRDEWNGWDGNEREERVEKWMERGESLFLQTHHQVRHDRHRQ